MNSFDDLLNSEILNELGTGGLRDAISTKVERKIGSIPDQIKAKLGSKAAKGRNNLRDMVAHLEDEFKVYCGEQSIRTQEAAVEDFLEFLRHRVHFNITDENFDRLAYGPAQSAPNEKKIRNMEQIALRNIEDNKPMEFQVLALANYARSTNGDGVMARKALWKMAREHPRHKREFQKVKDYVGRPLGPMFKKLSQQIAQLIIKLSDKNGLSKGTSQPGNEAEPVEPMNLDIGEQKVPSEIGIKRQGWFYKPLFAELTQYGLSAKLARKIGEELADVEPDSEAELDECRVMLRSIKRENGINIVRILLQAFRGARDHGGLMETYLSKKHPKLYAVYASELKKKPGQRTDDRDDDNQRIWTYDGTDLNKRLESAIPDALTAQGMIVVLLGCFGKLVES